MGYALGSASLAFAETSVGIFYLFYLTDIVGIGAAIAGTVFALPKVWDIIVDPVVGTWVDRLATRVRLRWPFVLVSGILIYFTYVGMFSIPQLGSHWAAVGLTFGLLIAFSTSRTVFGICQLSISTDITDDEAELGGIYSLSFTIYTIMALVGSALPPLLLTWSGGGRAGYSLMAAVGAGLSSVMLVACVLMTKSVPTKRVSATASKQSLLASFRATAKNGAFVALLGYYVMLCICTSIISAFMPYLSLYVVHGGGARLAVLAGIFSVTPLVGFPLAPSFIRRYGPRKSMKIGNLMMISTVAALFIASYLGPWVNWVVIAAVGVAIGLLSPVFMSALVDVSRVPVRGGLVVPLGFYFGVIISGSKLGQSAGSIVVGFLLAATGFVPGGAHQSDLTVMAIRLGYSLLPAVLFGMCGSFLNSLIKAPANAVPGSIR